MASSFLLAAHQRAMDVAAPVQSAAPTFTNSSLGLLTIDSDLLICVANWSTIEGVSLLCATCKCLRGAIPALLQAIASRESLLPTQTRLANDGARSALMPNGSEQWTFERLHLITSPPAFEPIVFEFASDALAGTTRHALQLVAAVLRRHPGLCILIRGYARTHALPHFGRALAQARAVRVRHHLLKYVSRTAGEQAAGEGVRPGGYSEGHEFDDVMAFYVPRMVGTRIQAIGDWSPFHRGPLFDASGVDGQCATIVVCGFLENTSLRR